MRRLARGPAMVAVCPWPFAGSLPYSILPAIVFILVQPYKNDRFVRFHSFQSIGVCLAAVVLGAILRIAGFALFFIPVLGHLLVWLLSMVVGLAFFMIWIVLIVKALQGEMLKLPLLGELAEQQTTAPNA